MRRWLSFTGEVMVTAEGNNRFGRHSWRAAGAVYLTSLGLEVVKIHMLARWESALITHYTRLAPLKTLGYDIKAALRKKRTKTTTSPDIYQPGLNNKNVKALMDTQLVDMKEEINRLQTLINKVELECRPKQYLKHRITGSHHKVLCSVADAGDGALTWCGWSNAKKKYEVLADIAPKHRDEICGECMPELKASLPDRGMATS